MKRHSFLKTLFILIFSLTSCALVFIYAGTQVQACTAVYVGGDASEDGTTIIARSNDNQANWPNHVVITERVENQPNRTMPVDNGHTVYTEIPATTYKYVCTPWMESTMAQNDLANDAAAAENEYGVAMTMAVTAFTNDPALQADPLLENGLTESTADDLVICQSASAREAVEILTGLIDKYGSSECNIALISDQTETWYVEMYTGHQYAAVKLPSDMVAVFGNEFTLEYLSDYEECIVSENLESLAKDNNFAVYDENGELNLMKTYALDTINYSHMRTWIGHQVLAPSIYSEDYDQNATYSLVFYPDEKVSLQDVMELMRNRYEGTEYSPDETGRLDMRVIGTDTAMSVHVLQVYPDLPANMSCVLWESTAPALYGVFVPVSVACTDVSECYGADQPASEVGNFDYQNYPWYAIKELNTLCLYDYKVYGAPVREYWHEAEKNMIAGMSQVLQTAAEESAISESSAVAYVTDYCNGLQEQAFSDEKALINTVMWYESQYSNTMKVGRNPETHEASYEKKQYDPLTVDLDGSFYATVPEYTQTKTDTSSNTNLLIACVLTIEFVASLILIYSSTKKRKHSDNSSQN